MAGELQRVPETSSNIEILKHAITINQLIGRYLDSGVILDHGTLAGLSDDDHPHYYNSARLSVVLADYALVTDLASYYTIAAADAAFAPIAHTHTTSNITDLSSYTGFDARYYTESEVDSLLAGKANSSHTHASTGITDFAEAVDDRVSSLLVAGTNITLTYNDGAGTLTIDAAGGSGAVATDSIWDAKGDLAVGTGSNTASRLAVGTDGHVLTADSTQATGVKWAAASGGGGSTIGAVVTRSTSQSNDGVTAVEFDTEVRDDGGCWSSSPNPSRLTVPSGEGGWYVLSGYIVWGAYTSNGRRAIIRKNGTTGIGRSSVGTLAAHNDPAMNPSAIDYATAGDYYELIADENAAAVATIQAGARFSMVKVA